MFLTITNMELNRNQNTDKHNLHCQLCLQLFGINQLEAEQKKNSGSTTLSIYQINLWKHLMIHPAPQQHGCINHSGLPTFIPDLPLLTLD
jgi:hypothetical protein